MGLILRRAANKVDRSNSWLRGYWHKSYSDFSVLYPARCDRNPVGINPFKIRSCVLSSHMLHHSDVIWALSRFTSTSIFYQQVVQIDIKENIKYLHDCSCMIVTAIDDDFRCVYINRNSRPELTHWGRDKMATISQTTLSIAFSWMKMLEFRLNFHWSLFLRVQLTIFQHWFR